MRAFLTWIITLSCLALMASGCTKGCSRKQAQTTPTPEQESIPEDQREVKTPNYSGITVVNVVKRDLMPGKGKKEVKDGHNVSVKYTEWVYDPAALANQGPQIYTTGDEARLLKIGDGKAIKGFEDGLKGMKKGGKRQLIIPPDMAYGEAGQPPKIPPRAMIMIDAEIVDVE